MTHRKRSTVFLALAGLAMSATMHAAVVVIMCNRAGDDGWSRATGLAVVLRCP